MRVYDLGRASELVGFPLEVAVRPAPPPILSPQGPPLDLDPCALRKPWGGQRHLFSGARLWFSHIGGYCLFLQGLGTVGHYLAIIFFPKIACSLHPLTARFGKKLIYLLISHF